MSEPKEQDPPQEPVNELIQQLEAEKQRAKQREFDLETERGHVKMLKHENQRLRQAAVQAQVSAEQEEEFISNTLLKHIAKLKEEKGDLLLQAEREEEFLTNTLHRRLSQLRKEKCDLELAHELEQEFVVNRLHKQMESLSGKPPEPNLTTSPSPSSMGYKGYIPGASPSRSASEIFNSSVGMVEMLKAEVTALRLKITELEKELVSLYNQSQGYKRELLDLKLAHNMEVGSLAVEDSPPSFLRPSYKVVRSRSTSVHEMPVMAPTIVRSSVRESRASEYLNRRLSEQLFAPESHSQHH